jgi:hypothetical protein
VRFLWTFNESSNGDGPLDSCARSLRKSKNLKGGINGLRHLPSQKKKRAEPNRQT